MPKQGPNSNNETKVQLVFVLVLQLVFFKCFLILIGMLEHECKCNLGDLFGSLVLEQLFKFLLIEVKLANAAILSRVCIEEFIDSILLIALNVEFDDCCLNKF